MAKLQELLEAAAGINVGYRVCKNDRDLEIGFLYGTAELVLVLVGLLAHESYSDRREHIAREIDCRAVEAGAPYRLTRDD